MPNRTPHAPDARATIEELIGSYSRLDDARQRVDEAKSAAADLVADLRKYLADDGLNVEEQALRVSRATELAFSYVRQILYGQKPPPTDVVDALVAIYRERTAVARAA